MTSTRTSATVESEVRSFIESWLDTLRSKDPDSVVSCFLPESSGFTLAPPLRYVQGGDEHRQFIRQWFSGFESSMKFEIRDLEIVASEDIAWCYFYEQISATPVGDEPFSFWFRVTLGLRKVNGQWKIAHHHESVPFHMDGSFLAAVELHPDPS